MPDEVVRFFGALGSTLLWSLVSILIVAVVFEVLEKRYKLLDEIFNKKILSKDFSMYLHRPSQTDPSMAPAGCDCFYVLIPVPNQLSGIDWRTEAQPFRNRVMELTSAFT